MHASRRVSCITASLLLAAGGATALAQSTVGSIYGNVTDTSGALIPNVTIVVKNVQTGVEQTTTANGSGEYTFTSINPGDYAVTSSATGFQGQTQTGVAVASNQNVHVTFALAAGNVNESIEVVAGVTLVDTRESQIAETIDQTRLQNLPTLNRQPYDLVLTTPGVSSYSPDTQTGSRNGSNFSVNGLPADTVSYYLDGAFNNSYKMGGGNKVPNPDALQEFRLITSNFDAEFGRTPGAVANVITRSGTASFHGAAYEYFRNDALNAKPYFQTSVTPLKQNQFGGTFGGPVPVLKKTFFFLSYEQLVLHSPAVVTAGSIIAPTNLERSGDFRQSTNKPNVSCNGVQYVICNNMLDPVAQNLLKFVPTTTTGQVAQQSAPANVESYQGLARLDFNGIANHAIEAMFFNTQGSQVAPTAGGNQIIGYSGMINTENQANIVLADVWTVNDRTVNTVRAFYTQNKYVIGNQYNNHFLADLGSTAPEGGVIFAPPKVNVNGYFSMGPAGAGPSNISQLQFGGIDTANLNRGHHSIKLGGSYVWNKYAEDGGNIAGGTFTFTGSTSKNALADFLMGRANSLDQTSSVYHRTHQSDPALFAQDDWQITSRLNLNLGMRWEIFSPQLYEPNVTGTFTAGKQSTTIPSAPIGFQFQGDRDVAPGLYNTSLLNFAPRFGFAYDAYGNGKTSIRGGVGLFYYALQQFLYGTMVQAPFSLTTTVNVIPGMVNPYAGSTYGSSPYPFAYTPMNPRFPSGATVNAVLPDGGSTPYVYAYNLTLEQQLSPAFALRIGYVGNELRKNTLPVDINAPLYTPGAAVSTAGLNCRRPYEPYRSTPASNAANNNCAFTGYNPAGTGFVFGSISQRTPAFNGNFNSLQVSLRGRVGNRFNLLASYVWAKALNISSPLVDNTNFRRNYGRAEVDIRHRFVASYLYHLGDPHLLGLFGHEVLGGWQLNGVTTLATGLPFTITSGTDTNLDGNNNDRVNVVGDPYTHAGSRQARISRFINTSALSIPSGPYGNEQRNQFSLPSITNTDLSLFKDFALFRESRLQFRAESFNVFGNVNLNALRTNFATLGTLSSAQNQFTGSADPRRLQFALKLLF